MRAKQFNELLDTVRSLTQTQRRKVIDAAQKASTIDDTVAVINEHVTPEHPCPHCNSQYIHRWGCEDAIQRYRCQDCRRTFNSLTGTPLARLKQRDAWSGFAQSMLDGLSVRNPMNLSLIYRVLSKTGRGYHHIFSTLGVMIQGGCQIAYGVRADFVRRKDVYTPDGLYFIVLTIEGQHVNAVVTGTRRVNILDS